MIKDLRRWFFRFIIFYTYVPFKHVDRTAVNKNAWPADILTELWTCKQETIIIHKTSSFINSGEYS